MRRFAAIAAIVAALGGLFVFGLLRGAPDRDIPSNRLGKAAPDFELPLYERYQPDYGETLRLSDLLGSPLVVNFWASWCLPCYDEAPVLQAFWEEYQESGVRFIGVQTQDRDRLDEGRAFLSQFSLGFPNGIDNSSAISVDWALYGVPETYFIGRDGVISFRHIGPVTAAVMTEQLEAILR